MDSIGRPWAAPLRGQLVQTTIESGALRGNPLGDPHVRPLWVYLPPGYDDDADRRYPAVYVIQGLTGQIDMWRTARHFGRRWWSESTSSSRPAMPRPASSSSSTAGRRWAAASIVDSPGTGRYHTYLCDEVVPFVDAGYRTIAGPERRAIAGKSSGGYGAMITPMLRPDLFGGLATHAGDALFECCYQPEFAASVRAPPRDHYDGSYERFWDDFRRRTAFTRDGDEELLNTWCMAACYSTDPDGTVRLPFDPATGRLDPDVWERWLEHDPVRMVAGHADALRSLRAIYIDAGTRDEWYLDLGAEAFRRELAAIGVNDVQFELFDATHMGIEYRYPIAMRYLAERLSA